MKLTLLFNNKIVNSREEMLAIVRKDPAYRVICHLDDGLAIYNCADGNPGKPTRVLARITDIGSARALLDRAYELDNAAQDGGWAPDESDEYVEQQIQARQDALKCWGDLPVRYGPYCSCWVLTEHPLAPTAPGATDADEVSNAKLVMLRKLRYRGIQFALTFCVTLLVVLLLTGGLSYLSLFYRNVTNQNLEDKMRELTRSMSNASSAISSVEAEIAARQKMVEQLKTDAGQYQALKDINSSQFEAISHALRLQIKEEAASGYWSDILKNLIFAVVGAIIGAIFSEVLAFMKKHSVG